MYQIDEPDASGGTFSLRHSYSLSQFSLDLREMSTTLVYKGLWRGYL